MKRHKSLKSEQQLKQLVDLYKKKNFPEVVEKAQILISHYPEVSLIWNLLGAANQYLSKYTEASEAFKKVTELNPNNADGFNNLGVALQNQGKLEDAKKAFDRVLLLDSQNHLAFFNLGNIYTDQHKQKEAVEAYKQAIRLKPDYSNAHYNIANVLSSQGELEEALSSYSKAIAFDPNHYKAYCNKANTLKEQGKLEEAINAYEKSLLLKPDFAEAYNGLGITLHDLGRLDDSINVYKKALQLQPASAEIYNNIGVAFQSQGNLSDAIDFYLKALSLDRNYAGGYNNLGNALHEQGQLEGAMASYEKAIFLSPKDASAYDNLGSVYKDLGRYGEAYESYKKALSLKPDYLKCYDNMLFALNYDDRLNSAAVYREYEAYGEMISSLKKIQFDHSSHRPLSGRRIRLGYSSPDFRGHACRYFMEPIFRNHNRDQFELFAYSNTRKPDQHTDRLREYFDRWINVLPMSDEAMAQRVYEDQIDILIDMAGHTKGNRLLVFAMRPAPIQVASSIGYGYTTGLNEMDFYLADENMVPQSSEVYFSEKVLRLPAPGFTYEPPIDITPKISPPPILHNGYITFGSLTRIARLNDHLFGVWKEILDLVPNSRLRLDQKPFARENTREMFWRRLEGLGIRREQVELVCSSSHWDGYRDIDICLDCWPHNAGTTTLESLWMGVPVLTKIDRTSVGHLGAAMLRPLGLDDWVVKDERSYIQKAACFASDTILLSALRTTLRQRLETSSLLDAKEYTLHLELAYKNMAKS